MYRALSQLRVCSKIDEHRVPKIIMFPHQNGHNWWVYRIFRHTHVASAGSQGHSLLWSQVHHGRFGRLVWENGAKFQVRKRGAIDR